MPSLAPLRILSDQPLGARPGQSDLAYFSLDATCAAVASQSVRASAYPSPPMSGSFPAAPRLGAYSAFEEQTATEGRRGEDFRRQSIYHGGPQGPVREASDRAYQEPTAPGHYAFPARVERDQRQPSRPVLQNPFSPAGPYLAAPSQGLDLHSARAAADLDSSRAQQKKTKRHVQCACVPCKTAHLRLVSSYLSNAVSGR